MSVIYVALSGKSMNEMVILFKMRQSEDDRKMPYCITSFDETADPFPR